MIFREYKVSVCPFRTFSWRKSPNPAPGTRDFFTASSGNRRGRAYFGSCPSNGLRITFRRGRTTCTGSEKRAGGRLWRIVAMINLAHQQARSAFDENSKLIQPKFRIDWKYRKLKFREENLLSKTWNLWVSTKTSYFRFNLVETNPKFNMRRYLSQQHRTTR